jgi:hypothetical protein
MLKILLFTSLLIPQLASAAGFSLNPAFGAYKRDSDNGISQLELRVGYTFDFGLYVGGFYSLGSEKFIDDSDEYVLGPMVGYQWNGIYGLLGYAVSAAQDLKSGGTKYSKGSGVEATIGYRMLVAEDVYLGPELTLRKIKYESVELQGVGSPVDRKDTLIIPGIAVQFQF